MYPLLLFLPQKLTDRENGNQSLLERKEKIGIRRAGKIKEIQQNLVEVTIVSYATTQFTDRLLMDFQAVGKTNWSSFEFGRSWWWRRKQRQDREGRVSKWKATKSSERREEETQRKRRSSRHARQSNRIILLSCAAFVSLSLSLSYWRLFLFDSLLPLFFTVISWRLQSVILCSLFFRLSLPRMESG